MWMRLRRFLDEPFFNKLHHFSSFYYKAKGALVYRYFFESFGTGSYIRRPLLIFNPAFISIGKNVGIRDGVRLEVVRSNKSRQPRIVIGDNTNIEQNVHIVCHNYVKIGSNVSITGNCSIVDVTHPFEDVSDPVKIGARILDEHSFVEIGDGTFVGFGSVILPNVRIGRCAVIGANSVVMKDVPDYTVVAGAPASIIKQFDAGNQAWVRFSKEREPEVWPQ